ncbi:tRNA pseudouridine(13) synthase TruD [Helicobacter kayseriensis]|uniref:tRNA pseudouridine(13) synthase TruD n=1 Tax=Helicobacter kayseriensis TaxID=2905877 RepID=UPI001E40D343|nr:tRNA pseudouridine(13) synthase TruD [Helicobacter kayseriensis]MCE3046784.1 tRNA pseudouridine(13) synthase TruD [Helicobacter kayseriensis]MCE3047914.1 tRNA pseudouridine(13) synthase TruD [Helicobacter kayseriensis]
MRIYPYSLTPINFHFVQSARDFIVKEIPLYEWSNHGEHLVLQIRKKGLSTPEMIQILCDVLGCRHKEIGYAGLKDKNALTTQFISIPYSLYSKLKESQNILSQKNLKILSIHRHNNKIKIGHLKGNSFFIRLKKVLPQDLEKIYSILEKISTEGMPNYFGYQRFGKFGDNYLKGKKIAHGEKKLRDRSLSDFLISSYQSYLFNQWLSHRIKLCSILKNFSKQEAFRGIKKSLKIELTLDEIENLQGQKTFFKILDGDALHHYPFGKLFFLDKITQEESQRFYLHNIVPCGILDGQKITYPSKLALKFQEDFLDSKIQEAGSYRFAWVFPQRLQYRYIQEKAHLELSFELPKGSYATILLETLANQELSGESDV